MAKQAKVPFNCLLPAETLNAIREAAKADNCSQADVVTRAVALLVFGEEITPRFESFVEKAKRTFNHDPIIIPPHTTTDSWRSDRKPLLKPKDRSK